jgi:hypothetical protein
MLEGFFLAGPLIADKVSPMRRVRPGLYLMTAVTLVLGVCGCASVSVTDVAHFPGPRPPMPERILVEEFSAPSVAFRVDRDGEALDMFRNEFARGLSRAIVERVDKHLLPAEVSDGDRKGGRRVWVVTGRFLRVNQGSRALRMSLGLGAGGSKLETRVVVYDLSGDKPRAILTFETTGGSNAAAGAVFNLNPWIAGAAAAGLALSGLSYDAVRTSREVTAVLSEYMAEQGMIDPRRAKRSKKLGQWP